MRIRRPPVDPVFRREPTWILLTALAGLLAAMVVLAGPALILLGVRGFLDNRHFVTSSAQAQGTVIDRVKRTYQSEFGGVDFMVPVIRFTARTGQVVTFIPHGAGSGDHPPDLPVGRTTSVIYDPHNPTHARLDSWTTRWTVGTFVDLGMALFGVCICIAVGFGLRAWWRSRRGTRRPRIGGRGRSAV